MHTHMHFSFFFFVCKNIESHAHATEDNLRERGKEERRTVMAETKEPGSWLVLERRMMMTRTMDNNQTKEGGYIR